MNALRAAVLIAAICACVTQAHAIQLQTLWKFTGADGALPRGSVSLLNGAIYGTTALGGTNGMGSVFKIDSSGISSRSFSGLDGRNPQGELLRARDGVFYGTTSSGGSSSSNNGTVFKITTNGVLTRLWSFTGEADGRTPLGGLVMDSGGTLYGTCSAGGTNPVGTVFKITTGGALTPIWSFVPSGEPAASLILAADGALYGTCTFGGTNFQGEVFRITTAGAYKRLWSFTGGADGAWPDSALVQAADGAFYGTTARGGTNQLGTIFKITTNGLLTTLWRFTGKADGSHPLAGLIQGKMGAFYGTTSSEGPSGAGTVFKLTANGALRTLWAFEGYNAGGYPADRLVQGGDGALYGTTTTTAGYTSTNGGTVFRLSFDRTDDFDGDDSSDIGVFCPASGAWNIANSSGGSATYQLGYGPDLAVAADYDGDGKADYALFEPPTGNWFIKYSSNGNFVMKNWGYSKSIPVPADYDGDGKTDIAVYDPPTGNWFILKSSDGGMIQQQWGWSQAIPVPADYDGDGKPDIATYVPATGQWSIRQSSNGQLRQVIGFGMSTAMPVPADYDGDGKADVATYVPGTGQWTILYSGYGVITQQNWGWYLAAPVPGDYDGDGKADIATYCAPAGLWYVLKSSGGMISQNWGWSQAVPTTPQFQINRRYFPTP